MREIRTYGSERAKAKWLRYSTNFAEMFLGFKDTQPQPSGNCVLLHRRALGESRKIVMNITDGGSIRT